MDETTADDLFEYHEALHSLEIFAETKLNPENSCIDLKRMSDTNLGKRSARPVEQMNRVGRRLKKTMPLKL